VLIHEIGHWLTHSCAIVNKDEILIQFDFLPKIITESLAQLTVIWSFYKHKSEFEYKLESFARLFMPKQPKPYYEFNKVYHMYSPEIILKRYLGIASQMTHLNEDKLFKLLAKNESDLSAIEIAVLDGKSI
jgi:tryptophan synthase beta subunit